MPTALELIPPVVPTAAQMREAEQQRRDLDPGWLGGFAAAAENAWAGVWGIGQLAGSLIETDKEFVLDEDNFAELSDGIPSEYWRAFVPSGEEHR